MGSSLTEMISSCPNTSEDANAWDRLYIRGDLGRRANPEGMKAEVLTLSVKSDMLASDIMSSGFVDKAILILQLSDP